MWWVCGTDELRPSGEPAARSSRGGSDESVCGRSKGGGVQCTADFERATSGADGAVTKLHQRSREQPEQLRGIAAQPGGVAVEVGSCVGVLGNGVWRWWFRWANVEGGAWRGGGVGEGSELRVVFAVCAV